MLLLLIKYDDVFWIIWDYNVYEIEKLGRYAYLVGSLSSYKVVIGEASNTEVFAKKKC